MQLSGWQAHRALEVHVLDSEGPTHNGNVRIGVGGAIVGCIKE